MKRIISIIFILLCSHLYSENVLKGNTFDYFNNTDYYVLDFREKDFDYIHKDNVNNTETVFKNLSYEIENDSGIDYILFEKDNVLNRWLVLYSNDILYLYDEDYADPFLSLYNTDQGIDPFFLQFSGQVVSVSSFLTEKTKQGLISYPAENLSERKLRFPWVEGVAGKGIGESIEINEKLGEDIKEIFLIISNGYVSYDRPDLYKKNGRVKRIRISDFETGDYLEYDVADTPHLQFFPYRSISKGSIGIEIKILDVYEGTMYSDTCVNFIGQYFINEGASDLLKRIFDSK